MTLEEKKIELLNSIPIKPIPFNDSLVNFVILDPAKPGDEVEVFIRSIRDPQNTIYHYGPVLIAGTPADFMAAIEKMRRLSLYRPAPAVRTRSLDPSELQPYSDRYIAAYKIQIRPATLLKLRTDLWIEYSKKYIPKYTATAEKKKRQKNFADALDNALDDYKASLGKDPYEY